MRVLIAILLLAATSDAAPRKKSHAVPPARAGGTVVELCDGQTSLEVRALKPGEALSRAEAQRVSDRLMAVWLKKNPGAGWDTTLAQNSAPVGEVRHGVAPAAPATSTSPAGEPGSPAPTQTGTYSDFTGRDALVWRDETEKFIAEGKRIFHDAKPVGGTIGVSCDMCHPNAANTHPETYPKFQTQLGRVALLRDMINWCIENPVKGRPLPDDDNRLRALEAYIYAQRRGVQLDYGRH